MKNKVKVIMTALVLSAMACTSPKTPETPDVDTLAIDTVATPADTIHTGVQQNDSASVSK